MPICSALGYNMTEDSYYSTSPLSAAMTTAESTSMSSPSTLEVMAFYFRCGIIVIGIVGTVANALVLYALVASGQHRKLLLIFNQNVFDLCSSILLVVTYAVQLAKIPLNGTLGTFICYTFITDSLLWCTLNGAVINIAAVTVERYLKVVHPTASKKLLRKWVVYSVMAFAWIAGFVYNVALENEEPLALRVERYLIIELETKGPQYEGTTR